MKKYIIITIFVALVGCGTIKKWFGSEEKSEPKVEETFRPPLPGEIVENPDGSWTISLSQPMEP
jgi:flagellar basal body-associated protein FliL|tara:strand:+ start:140 stop:331 length:192 start_codon:yes stop_codon:yes gene_type:complete